MSDTVEPPAPIINLTNASLGDVRAITHSPAGKVSVEAVVARSGHIPVTASGSGGAKRVD